MEYGDLFTPLQCVAATQLSKAFAVRLNNILILQYFPTATEAQTYPIGIAEKTDM